MPDILRVTCGKCGMTTETDCVVYVDGHATCPNCMEPLTGDIKVGFRVYEPKSDSEEIGKPK